MGGYFYLYTWRGWCSGLSHGVVVPTFAGSNPVSRPNNNEGDNMALINKIQKWINNILRLKEFA